MRTVWHLLKNILAVTIVIATFQNCGGKFEVQVPSDQIRSTATLASSIGDNNPPPTELHFHKLKVAGPCPDSSTVESTVVDDRKGKIFLTRKDCQDMTPVEVDPADLVRPVSNENIIVYKGQLHQLDVFSNDPLKGELTYCQKSSTVDGLSLILDVTLKIFRGAEEGDYFIMNLGLSNRSGSEPAALVAMAATRNSVTPPEQIFVGPVYPIEDPENKLELTFSGSDTASLSYRFVQMNGELLEGSESNLRCYKP